MHLDCDSVQAHGGLFPRQSTAVSVTHGSDEATSIVRLADCVRLMQSDLVHANPRSDTTERFVTDVMLYDPVDDWTSLDGRIILAVGCTYGSPGFDALLQRASAGNAAAVMVKAYGANLELLGSTADSHSVAMLVAPHDADWTRLAALARSAVVGAAVDTVSGVRLGDLYAFANAIASITDGAASIVDTFGNVVGYSTLPGQPIDEIRRLTTLTLQEPEPPAFDPGFKKVYASGNALVMPSPSGGMDRLALAVRAGGELLGSIWVIDPGNEKRAAALQALDRMGDLAGLHMLNARSESDFGQRRSSDLIRTLVDDPPSAPFAAAQLGLDFAHEIAVAAFSIVRPERGNLDAFREVRRLLHLITTICNVQFGTSHSAVIDSVVYALLPADGANPRATQRRVIEEICTYANTITTGPLIASLGSIAPKIEQVAQSKDEALETLHYLGKLYRSGAWPGTQHISGMYEDHRVPLSLLKIGHFVADAGLHFDDGIDRLRRHDQEHGTDYLPTLLAYFVHNANISAMAASLQVHNNTVRYRMTRLAEEFELNLEDPNSRLWAWLRLSISELSGPH